jgi:hypothetical protein
MNGGFMEDGNLKNWRTKAEEGTLTQEELKEAIKLLRAGRVSACFAAKEVRAKIAREPLPDGATLIELLKGINHE